MDKYTMTKKDAKRILKENHNRLRDPDMTAFVSLNNVNKIYPNGVQAVYDFNLDIDRHDFIALVGPSGCGKSTTLRMIAGLEEISNGSLYIDGIYSNYLQSKERNIAMVFQSYALYPQMTVFDNIAFGLKIRHVPKEEIEKRVFEAAEILDLGDYLDRKPKELSGGQMQRVALGRAIVRQADLFLMDEPLSNLDAKLRVQMRSEIIRIHREVGATTIYVTHDQTEAMTMANKIVVMNKGFIQQTGRAMDVYNHPRNLFVATFIGSPAMNILDGLYCNDRVQLGGGPSIVLPREFAEKYYRFVSNQIQQLEDKLSNFDDLSDEIIAAMRSAQIYRKDESKPLYPQKKKFKLFAKKKKNPTEENAAKREKILLLTKQLLEHYQQSLQQGRVKVGIRPEHIFLEGDFNGLSASAPIKARVSMIERLGNESILHFNILNTDFQVKTNRPDQLEIGDEVSFVIDIDKVHIFDVESGLSIR